MVKKMVFGNFKGGVGKTTNSVMTAYELAKKGYKTLVCDLDPQSNSTQLLRRTYKLQTGKDLNIETTMMTALQNESLGEIVVPINENLFLIPSYKDFMNYPDFLELKFPAQKNTNYMEERISFFGKQLSDVENDFDYIIFDVPPTLSRYTDSAIYSSDYVIIVLQTQQRSLDGAGAFFEYLQDFYNKYENINFSIAGVLPVLMKNKAGIDDQIINDAKEAFGDDLLFNIVIKHMERLKRYDRMGIAEKGITDISDYHDVKVHNVYSNLADEIIERSGGNK